MTGARADLGFGGELDGFNPDDWKPQPKKATAPAVAAEAAAAAGFKSREAAPPKETPKGDQRRRRTGRNVQFNIKARPDTIDAFCAVADGQGWGLGETLEQAVALLQQAYPPKG